jgi:arabinose-5-phosphate isomerase
MSSAARHGWVERPDARAEIEHPLEIGRRVIQHEGRALVNLAAQLDEAFCRAVACLEACRGSVIVSGMGKAGLIGQKIAATLASTGTRSHFLHPAEAIHGDLGRIHADDVLLLLSHSGETEEVLRLLPSLADLGVPILAITGRPRSRLARGSTVTLWIGQLEEAGRLRLAPTTSTTAMLALGDALALATSQRRGFTPDDFARFHPGGSLGRQLTRVEEVMRPLHECRVATHDLTVRHVLVSRGRPGRRSGAVLLVDHQGVLAGIFTDSDLARLLEQQRDQLLDEPISRVMTSSPTTVAQGTMMAAAVDILTARKISELPVVDDQRHPMGLIDITDVVAFMPRDGDGKGDAIEATERGQHHSQCHSTRDPGTDRSPIILPLTNQRGAQHVDETRRQMSSD